MEAGETGYFSYPALTERRVDINEIVEAAAEGVAEVPYGSEDQLGVAAAIFVEIAAAVERLAIVCYLLNEVETHQRIHVDIVFP